MTSSANDLKRSSIAQKGFTLIELMVVVAILGVILSITFASYQRYSLKTKRTDMMTEMQNIASQIESNKLVKGNYSNDLITDLGGNYPAQGKTLYKVTFTPDPLTSDWTIIATPQANGMMADDGVLSLNYLNNKCRDAVCSRGDEWNQ